MRDAILYKPRKNIWEEEVRKEEGKGSTLENILPEVFQCIGAGLFFGSATFSLPTPSFFLTLSDHLRKESLFRQTLVCTQRVFLVLIQLSSRSVHLLRKIVYCFIEVFWQGSVEVIVSFVCH